MPADQPQQTWRKSTFSGTETDNCVEVAARLGTVAVRDSKNVDGPMLRFSAEPWRDACAWLART